jgi:hypothetical protein
VTKDVLGDVITLAKAEGGPKTLEEMVGQIENTETLNWANTWLSRYDGPEIKSLLAYIGDRLKVN